MLASMSVERAAIMFILLFALAYTAMQILWTLGMFR
jgi:hypothetical protein